MYSATPNQVSFIRSLAEWRARRRDVLPRAWRTGASILYLGRELTLAVHPAGEIAGARPSAIRQPAGRPP
jgi:hypothetical protein